MRTHPTHCCLESSGLVTNMKTHLRSVDRLLIWVQYNQTMQGRLNECECVVLSVIIRLKFDRSL